MLSERVALSEEAAVSKIGYFRSMSSGSSSPESKILKTSSADRGRRRRAAPSSSHENVAARRSMGFTVSPKGSAGSGGVSGGSSHLTQYGDLPRSVRNAPQELRAEIRRRQNTESARRGRQRQREELEDIQRKIQANADRIGVLEKRVEELTADLYSRTKEKARKQQKGNISDASSKKSNAE